MGGDLGLGGSEAGGLGDAGYGPSGGPSYGDTGYSGNYNAGNYSASVAGYGVNEGIAGLGPSGIGPGKAALDTLSQLGYGSYQGVNPNNPTQSVDEMLAAQNIHDILNYTVPALVSMVPGYSTVSALGKGIANIHGLIEGRLTPAEVIPGLAAGLISAKTGIPSGVLEGVFAGDLGRTAGAGAQAGLGALASNFGPVGSLAYGLSGLGSAVNRGVSEAVSGATGGARSGGLGSFSGAGPAPSASTAPTGSAYGDAGITQEISPTRAAIEQAVREASIPAWDRQIVAGRYGPTMQYEYGA